MPAARVLHTGADGGLVVVDALGVHRERSLVALVRLDDTVHRAVDLHAGPRGRLDRIIGEQRLGLQERVEVAGMAVEIEVLGPRGAVLEPALHRGVICGTIGLRRELRHQQDVGDGLGAALELGGKRVEARSAADGAAVHRGHLLAPVHQRDVAVEHGLVHVGDTGVGDIPLRARDDGVDAADALDELVAVGAGVGDLGVLHHGAVGIQAVTRGDELHDVGHLVGDHLHTRVVLGDDGAAQHREARIGTVRTGLGVAVKALGRLLGVALDRLHSGLDVLVIGVIGHDHEDVAQRVRAADLPIPPVAGGVAAVVLLVLHHEVHGVHDVLEQVAVLIEFAALHAERQRELLDLGELRGVIRRGGIRSDLGPQAVATLGRIELLPELLALGADLGDVGRDVLIGQVDLVAAGHALDPAIHHGVVVGLVVGRGHGDLERILLGAVHQQLHGRCAGLLRGEHAVLVHGDSGALDLVGDLGALGHVAGDAVAQEALVARGDRELALGEIGAEAVDDAQLVRGSDLRVVLGGDGDDRPADALRRHDAVGRNGRDRIVGGRENDLLALGLRGVERHRCGEGLAHAQRGGSVRERDALDVDILVGLDLVDAGAVLLLVARMGPHLMLNELEIAHVLRLDGDLHVLLHAAVLAAHDLVDLLPILAVGRNQQLPVGGLGMEADDDLAHRLDRTHVHLQPLLVGLGARPARRLGHVAVGSHRRGEAAVGHLGARRGHALVDRQVARQVRREGIAAPGDAKEGRREQCDRDLPSRPAYKLHLVPLFLLRAGLTPTPANPRVRNFDIIRST